MKLTKIITIMIIAPLLGFSIHADENKTAPIVGSTIVDVAVTEIYATGYRASKLLHAAVYNAAGDKVGHIDDFIVGSSNGVTVAIVSVGGFLGLGKRHIAVPAVLFKMNSKGKLELANATKDELKSLPEFNYAR